MNDRQVLEGHLLGVSSVGEWYIQSSPIRALRAIREVTGRDKQGKKIRGQSHGSFLGVIGYMVLLDQIGKCFQPTKPIRVPDSKSPIIKALTYFSKLEKSEIDALYGLRCALAHDYSLYNTNPKRPEYQHNFALIQGKEPRKVVILPQQPWDGDYKNKNITNRTIINVERFGDLVENVYQHLIALFRRYQLKVVLDGGVEELKQRYEIWTKDNKK